MAKKPELTARRVELHDVAMIPESPAKTMTVRNAASYVNVDEGPSTRLAERGAGVKVAVVWRLLSEGDEADR